MSLLRVTYLALAIWGAVHPTLWVLDWAREKGWNPWVLIEGWQANAATTGLTIDLLIAAITLSVWAIAETWVRRNWVALWAIPVTFLVGLSCGLPLYLFLRTRPVG